MPDWIAISRTAHAHTHWRQRDQYHFASTQTAIPVTLAELPSLVPHYPLALMQQQGQWQLVAMTGLLPEKNLYVHPDGRWLCGYVPAILRAHPFRLIPQGEQYVLCIQPDYLTDDESAPRLFDEEGRLHPSLEKGQAALQQLAVGQQKTATAAQALAEADVLEPWPLTIDRGEGQQPLEVGGLYRISEKALNGLESDAYLTLKGAPMALAHAQLFSTHNLHQLTQRGELLAKLDAQNTVPENLDSVLDGMDDDDDLTFDFDS